LRAAEWKASGSLQAFAGFGVRAAIASTLDLLQQPRMGASPIGCREENSSGRGRGELAERERERERRKKTKD